MDVTKINFRIMLNVPESEAFINCTTRAVAATSSTSIYITTTMADMTSILTFNDY